MSDRYQSGDVVQEGRPAGTSDSGSHSLAEHESVQAPVNVHLPAQRGDQIRWGPVWAGLLTALALFMLVELLFFWLGWLTLQQGEAGSTAALVTGIIGLVAFFVGGLIAGASAMWRGIGSGMLQGALVWALGVVAFLFITLFGGGALIGSFGNIATQVANIDQVTSQLSDVQAQEAVTAAREDAGWAVLGLVLPLAAAAIGGAVGAKMWPRNRDEAETATAR